MDSSGSTIQKFNSPEFGAVRVVERDGEVLFVASDVCAALGLSNVSKAISGLDSDERSSITISDGTPGNPNKAVVTEPGLYKLVMRSRKREAKTFQRWVTHDVLPSIRARGGYLAPAETPEETMARAVLLAQQTIERRERELAALREENEGLRPKAAFADAVGDTDGTVLVGDLAKMMAQNGVDVGQNRLFEWLRRDGLLGKSGSHRNRPTQRAMEMGLFRLKETAVRHADGRVTTSVTPKVTGKGQRYLMAKYCTQTAIDLDEE